MGDFGLKFLSPINKGRETISHPLTYVLGHAVDVDVDGLADDANANAKTNVEATAGADVYCLSTQRQCNAMQCGA